MKTVRGTRQMREKKMTSRAEEFKAGIFQTRGLMLAVSCLFFTNGTLMAFPLIPVWFVLVFGPMSGLSMFLLISENVAEFKFWLQLEEEIGKRPY